MYDVEKVNAVIKCFKEVQCNDTTGVSNILTDLIVSRNNNGRYLEKDNFNELLSSFDDSKKVEILTDIVFGVADYLSLKPRKEATKTFSFIPQCYGQVDFWKRFSDGQFIILTTTMGDIYDFLEKWSLEAKLSEEESLELIDSTTTFCKKIGVPFVYFSVKMCDGKYQVRYNQISKETFFLDMTKCFVWKNELI